MTDESPIHFTSFGPLDGPVLIDSEPGILPVFDSSTTRGSSIGTAHPAGLVTEDTALVQLFRLKIQDEWLKGLWVCDRRAFVRLSKRADPHAPQARSQ